jgi:two-component system response regulator HydG
MPKELQTSLVATLDQGHFHGRVLATSEYANPHMDGLAVRALVDARLACQVSTIAIELPRLVDRLDDLPLLAQSFLEAANRNSSKQIGGLTAEALDLLALYAWPGELFELKQVIEAAHWNCQGHQIQPGELPPVIHHAKQAASLAPPAEERIVLENFLAGIER